MVRFGRVKHKFGEPLPQASMATRLTACSRCNQVPPMHKETMDWLITRIMTGARRISGDDSYENFHTQAEISVLTDEVAHGAGATVEFDIPPSSGRGRSSSHHHHHCTRPHLSASLLAGMCPNLQPWRASLPGVAISFDPRCVML